jgi:pimeloyl-ACP methyl ester carboxylesterase
MPDWTTGICTVNGVSVYYHRTGGDKPPIVLLHGLMANGMCWTPLAQTLEKDYDVVMPDARGHGNSDAPAYGYRYDKLAADVVGLIDTLELVTPVLLGHSMGGMTAAVVASSSPQRLRGLILADPTFLTPQRQREVHASNIRDQHCRIINRPKEDFLTEIQDRHSHRSSNIIELIKLARFQTNIQAFEILTPPNPDYVQLIHTLDIPSLLVIGGVGSIVSPEVAEELAKLNQRLKVVQIKEAGHGVPYDQPERFSAIVQNFLRSVTDV